MQQSAFDMSWLGVSMTPTRRSDGIPASTAEPIPLPTRFAHIKQALIAGNEAAVVASWHRLLLRLQQEVEVIASMGSGIIPAIDFSDIQDPVRVHEFTTELRTRGAAIVRNVVPRHVALSWREETIEYLSMNPHARGFPSRDANLRPIYWSPAQIKARAHPNVLTAQRFLMGGLWESSDDSAAVSTSFPVTYADRLRIRIPSSFDGVDDDSTSSLLYHTSAHIDGGSVERWEPDGYGQGGTYEAIWEGRWEEYDPWESSTRLRVTSDLYNGAGSCSMFRMFQGWLPMSRIDPGEGTPLVCPMIQLSTAYFLLRPFFSPKTMLPNNGNAASGATAPNFLDPTNWVFDMHQTSVIQGALPSYTQELNGLLHPHLQLGRSMVHIPRVEPGDYVVWHCDMIYGVDRTFPFPPALAASSNPLGAPSFFSAFTAAATVDATVMYVPACPLTQTNALYLARQRKAFLLGHPSPDFGGGRGESSHLGRPGVQEVSDAGGEDALRAMGLLPWDENAALTDGEREVLRMANAILFPDRYEMV